LKFYHSIRAKILAFCVCISIIPTSIIFLFTMHSYTETYTSQIASLTTNTVQNTTESIEQNFKNISVLESALLFSQYEGNNVFISICDQERALSHIQPIQRLQNQKKYEYICSNLISNNTFAEGIYLFTDSGYTYSFTKNKEFWIGDTPPNGGWRKKLDGINSTCVQPFVPKHSENGQKYILFAKKFRNLEGKATGTLAIVCNKLVLNQNGNNSASKNDVYVLLPDGEMLSGSGQSEKLNLTKSQIEQINSCDNGYVSSDSSRDIIVYGTLEDLGWKTVSKVSLNPIYDAYVHNRTYFICFMAAVIIIISFLVYELDKIIIRPIVYLSHSMNNTSMLESDSFQNTCPDRKDEIGILYSCFERMLKRIHKLIEERYKSEIRYLKSCLKNLTSQINSHFLFNTLENINDCAIIAHNDKIAVMSKSLGDLLRYSIDYETDEVPLQAELEQTRKYICIQEVKFGHPIQFRTDVEDGLLEHKVMKFFLQPIIENAIEHGLQNEIADGKIELNAFHVNNAMHITIYDNGDSIPEEKLQEIRRSILSKGKLKTDQRHVGVGLSNIKQRLNLMYPGKSSLKIRNAERMGVVVEVIIPY